MNIHKDLYFFYWQYITFQTIMEYFILILVKTGYMIASNYMTYHSITCLSSDYCFIRSPTFHQNFHISFGISWVVFVSCIIEEISTSCWIIILLHVTTSLIQCTTYEWGWRTWRHGYTGSIQGTAGSQCNAG